MAPEPVARVIVVRAGPRRWVQPTIDRAALGIGLALLVSSVLLVEALPQDDPRTPQYRWSFPTESSLEANDNRPMFPATSVYVRDDGEVLLPFVVPHANVFDATVTLYAPDDHPATLPDAFEVSLIMPNGTSYLYAGDGIVWTGPSEPNPAETPNIQFWIPDEAHAKKLLRFNLGGSPQEDIVSLTRGATLEEAKAAASMQHARPQTQGEWQVRIRPVTLGGCPEIDPTGLRPDHALECRIQTPLDPKPAGAPDDWQPGDPTQPTRDHGNAFIVSFEYSFYDILVKPI